MPRSYSLPGRLPTETNWEWCQRAADSIPPEVLAEALIRYIHDSKSRKRRRVPVWSEIGDLLGHGAGVSSAIAEKYWPDDLPKED